MIDSTLRASRGFDPQTAHRTFTVMASDYVLLLLLGPLVAEPTRPPPPPRLRPLSRPGRRPGSSSGGLSRRWPVCPCPARKVRAHFDAAFWAQASPAMLNQALQALISLRVLAIRLSELNTVVADVAGGDTGARAQVLLIVDRRGLISWLRISPDLAGPAPATWAGADAAVQPAAPQVRLLVADITGGSCQPVHDLDPGTQAPLGAAVKLYVLDALGDAVAAGTAAPLPDRRTGWLLLKATVHGPRFISLFHTPLVRGTPETIY